MLDLEREVHTCTKCKHNESLESVRRHFPVYSFGDPLRKNIVVVGQNPSDKEYENGNLSSSHSIVERRKSQLTYFKRETIHPYFPNKIGKFFEGQVQKRLNWIDLPWEKVGYLDLVKCPTRVRKGNTNVGQWSKVDHERQRKLIKNCEGHLRKQVRFYKPKIILAYGKDVGKWFGKNYLRKREDYEDLQYEVRRARIDNRVVRLLFVPQRQGVTPHSKPELFWIRKKILKMIDGRRSWNGRP
jgi:uracil-DNA glycosylase